MQQTKRLIDIKLTNEPILISSDEVNVLTLVEEETNPVVLATIYSYDSSDVSSFVVSCNISGESYDDLVLKADLEQYYATKSDVTNLMTSSDMIDAAVDAVSSSVTSKCTLSVLSANCVSAIDSILIKKDDPDTIPQLSTRFVDIYADKSMTLDSNSNLYQWFFNTVDYHFGGWLHDAYVKVSLLESQTNQAVSRYYAIKNSLYNKSQLSDYVSKTSYDSLELRVRTLENMILDDRLTVPVDGKQTILFTFTSADASHMMSVDLSRCLSETTASLKLPNGTQIELSSGCIDSSYLLDEGIYTIFADHMMLPLSAVSTTYDGSPTLYVNEDNQAIELSVVENSGNIYKFLQFGFVITTSLGQDIKFIVPFGDGSEPYTNIDPDDASSVKAIALPLKATEVPYNFMAGCTTLQDVMMYGGSNLSAMGDNAFSGCTYLRTIVIPNGVVKIGDYAFSGCERIQRIVIPASVHCIGIHAFDGISEDCILVIEDPLFAGITTIDELRRALALRYPDENPPMTSSVLDDYYEQLNALSDMHNLPGGITTIYTI